MRNALMLRAYRHSFQIRLFAAITGMTILFIAATGYFSYLLGRRSVEKQIERYAVGTAAQITERVRTFLLQPAKEVSLLSAAIENGFIDPSNAKALIRFFHLVQDDYPEFLNINYGDKDGRFTMVPPQRPEVHKLFDPRIRPWYVGALEQKRLYWTQVYVFASSQHPGITVSTPVMDKNRSVSGVCAIDIDLSTFSRFLNTLKIGEKGYAYIIDNEQGRVIAHPELLNPHFNPDQIRFLNAGLTSLKASNKTFDLVVVKGEAFFTAYTDYPESNWSVGVNLPVSDFLENINAIKKATATLVLVAICISCVVSYLVALTIVKPLRTLEQGIKRVSAGDLDYKVRLHDPSIVGTLADAFNQMAASLKQSQKELKKTYFELAEKEKMAALGQLTAGIAHEIKNPLGIILGSAQVVANPKKPEAMRNRAAQFIIDEVIRLNNTLTAFLAFARPAPPNLVKTDLIQLLDETLESISETFDNQMIQVEKTIGAPTVQCAADPDQMRQVFLNILLNATQAMPSGGRLTVKAVLKKQRTAADTGRFIVITISDTGEGINSDRLEKIFEPFATFKDDGTGLGLSIVTQILKLHHAGITVESEPGRGSVFAIHFPCSEETNHAS
ncbi:MAG: Cache 3/Cache 2 fusion domain-containing protein [Desulfosarcina sp.]|nr:Cache 3/Cache 2 fusion domain-containing protein [Desulfosarcina sp.]MBC2742739.1 Cache 3/Cache 2 fusion domain-containing protein [Desulfosarcina sp.]MBC2765649.1 HAMP domain-containing protein [Desulfosarcina sp.]